MTASCCPTGSLVTRVQGAFLEAPGLRLTLRDAQYRFDLDELTCKAVLEALVDAGVLTRTGEGNYVRLFPRLVPRAARAGTPHRPRVSGRGHAGTRSYAGHAA